MRVIFLAGKAQFFMFPNTQHGNDVLSFFVSNCLYVYLRALWFCVPPLLLLMFIPFFSHRHIRPYFT